MKNLIIFGGGGYCSSILIPQLLEKNYNVTVYDTFWYGKDHLPISPNLSLVEGDVRDIDLVSKSLQNQDSVLHLSCISNDTSFELDENLSTSINLDSFEPIVIAAKEKGVSRFVFASSSSVYGVSEEPNVDESHPLVPLTLYNKYKGMCEPLLFKHTDNNFTGVVFRPATVCGYSPRQRLDLSVNILTNFAVNKGKITVFGGDQLRPNLHINDYADLCETLLTIDKSLIANEIFNCGYQNMSIMDIALTVKKVVEELFPDKGEIKIEVTDSDDPRSYHISSEKIKNKINFVPKRSVEDAVRDLCDAFKNNLLPNSFDDDKFFNVRTMKKLEVK
tara:strand:+ start:13671 stop:14669 length:999 start_codon:yes stop_codon:yes gene_type:complete